MCACSANCGHNDKTLWPQGQDIITLSTGGLALFPARQTCLEDTCKAEPVNTTDASTANLQLLHQIAAAGGSQPFNAAARQQVLASLVMCCSSRNQPCVQAGLSTTHFVAHILHQKLCSFIGDLYAAQIQHSVKLPRQPLMMVLHQMR